jgi:hypothetical protein
MEGEFMDKIPPDGRIRSDNDIPLYNLTPTPSTSENRIDLANPQPQELLDDAELLAVNPALSAAPRQLIQLLEQMRDMSPQKDKSRIQGLVQQAEDLQKAIEASWDFNGEPEDYLEHRAYVVGLEKIALRHLNQLRQDPSYQFTFQVKDGVPRDLEPAIHLDKLDAAPPLSRLKKLAGALTGVLMAGGIIALLLSNPVGWGLLAGGLVVLAVILARSSKEHRSELVQWAAGGLLLAPLAVIWVMAGYYVEPKEEGA